MAKVRENLIPLRSYSVLLEGTDDHKIISDTFPDTPNYDAASDYFVQFDSFEEAVRCATHINYLRHTLQISRKQLQNALEQIIRQKD